ncbi:hypothetical protein [Candidatus Phytoplasma oryzae]|nr:hypothetical protein [Candidatus Phytoplasma oryzae]
MQLIKREREKTFQDLSLTIKNLYFNPAEKKSKDFVSRKKRNKNE